MRPGEPTYHTTIATLWRVDINDWQDPPTTAWFTSQTAAYRFMASYDADVRRFAATVVGPVEVEER